MVETFESQRYEDRKKKTQTHAATDVRTWLNDTFTHAQTDVVWWQSCFDNEQTWWPDPHLLSCDNCRRTGWFCKMLPITCAPQTAPKMSVFRRVSWPKTVLFVACCARIFTFDWDNVPIYTLCRTHEHRHTDTDKNAETIPALSERAFVCCGLRHLESIRSEDSGWQVVKHAGDRILLSKIGRHNDHS